jgi:hypothetical protein
MKSGSSDRELGIADRFVAGSIAGAAAQSVIYPLEVSGRLHFTVE